MKRSAGHKAYCNDRDVKADPSAYFIHTFALGMPKSLATVKAASDRSDGSLSARRIDQNLQDGRSGVLVN